MKEVTTKRGAVLKIFESNDWVIFNSPFLPEELPDEVLKKLDFNLMFALQTVEKTNKNKLIIGKVMDKSNIHLYLNDEEQKAYQTIKLLSNVSNYHLFVSFNQNGIFQGFVMEDSNLPNLPVRAFGVWFCVKILKK